MSSLECPRLRPGLVLAEVESDPEHLYLCDESCLGVPPQRLSQREATWLRLIDGERTLREIQTAAMRLLDGIVLPLNVFSAFIMRLEEGYFLDGPRFRERVRQWERDWRAKPIREPSQIGCYPGEPEALRRQLRYYFTGPKGPGLPSEQPRDNRLRAALLPHIDYQRGGHSYAWGFKELVEHTTASLFVIIGTSHYSGHRFTLTRKHFKTPLGIVPTDQAFVDRLVEHYGDGLFDDELAHQPEHSIELEIVFLQYLYGQRGPLRIVPLVVGSFHDALVTGGLPRAQDDIGQMIEALRRVEKETDEPICYLISGDLAHIGPKFGDSGPVTDAQLTHSKRQDQALLTQIEAAAPSDYFHLVAEESDRRRICGLPPTYTVLEAARPSTGKVLHYEQYVDPRRRESVSFASVAFYR
jgi:AmmeMemoRadiSam system protein B